MQKRVSRSANFKISPGAVSKLTELRSHFNKPLKFRVYTDSDGELQLRVHDKDYSGDWTMQVADIGIALCQTTLENAQHLSIRCKSSEKNLSGFDFVLATKNNAVNIFDGDEIIARILSEEAEVCDAYGEYCYTTYVVPQSAEIQSI